MGIVVIGDVFIDIKGYSTSPYIPYGRNAGTIVQIHGGVGRNVVEDIANVELEPTFVSLVDDDAMGEDVIDTTGAGDAFFSGVCIGLTYGKTLREACGIGTRLASTVICTSENICPRFMPEEFGLKR